MIHPLASLIAPSKHKEPTMTETVTPTETPAFVPFTPTLEGLLAWAEEEHAKKLAGLPSEWDQGHWAIQRPDGTPIAASCATACCIAGKTVAALGGRFLLEETGGSYLIATDAELPTGKRVNVKDYAAERLGLPRVQAERLFDADNTIHDVRRIIGALLDDPDADVLGAQDYQGDDEDEDFDI